MRRLQCIILNCLTLLINFNHFFSIISVATLLALTLGCFAQAQQDDRNIQNGTTDQPEEGPELQNASYSIDRPNSKVRISV